MANPKTPTALRLLNGNPGKRAMPKSEPEPTGENLRAQKGWPAGLMKKARPFYKRLLESMPAELYRTADAQALVNYSNAAALAAQCVENLDRDGPVVEGLEGLKQSPWAQVLRQQMEVMNTWGSQLGLTPVARAKMSMPEKPKTSRFDTITGGKK